MYDLRPGDFRWEVWHPILGVFLVNLSALLNEYRAGSAPAGVFPAKTIGANGGPIGITLRSAVAFIASTTYVYRRGAVTRDMAEALTFDASNGLLLLFADRDSFLCDTQSFLEDGVGCVSVRYL